MTGWMKCALAVVRAALTANQFMIEFAIEALDRREWPRTEAEMRVARASRFAAQVLARDLIAVGRENQVEIIANSSPRLCPM